MNDGSASTILVTGSSGLIGSEVCTYFSNLGWSVHGADNNSRATFFGPKGDTRWNQERLLQTLRGFRHNELDIRDRAAVLALLESVRPAAVVHCAAQPSHDLAARVPFADFDTNAVGTLNVLEGMRRATPESPLVYLSTNKVYGDAPNELPLRELDTRWEYARDEDRGGITESMRIDQSKHSLFGASKVAADVMVQEYGRYFGMKTCCLRAGCVTGPNHAGVELHGFLSYLVKCNITGQKYNVYGYKGKQVRDNIHALDVARFAHTFVEKPRSSEVYNLGGGRDNSCSILEAFDKVARISGNEMVYEYVDQNRAGDHVLYISDLSKIFAHYPAFRLTRTLDEIFDEIHASWKARLG